MERGWRSEGLAGDVADAVLSATIMVLKWRIHPEFCAAPAKIAFRDCSTARACRSRRALAGPSVGQMAPGVWPARRRAQGMAQRWWPCGRWPREQRPRNRKPMSAHRYCCPPPALPPGSCTKAKDRQRKQVQTARRAFRIVEIDDQKRAGLQERDRWRRTRCRTTRSSLCRWRRGCAARRFAAHDHSQERNDEDRAGHALPRRTGRGVDEALKAHRAYNTHQSSHGLEESHPEG